MEPFWKNNKYQAPVHSKEKYLVGFQTENKDWPMLNGRHIKSLPAYSALKGVFKDLWTDGELAEKKKNIIARLEDKTKKRRKQQWQYKDFADTLMKRIQQFERTAELNAWLGCFLEYYRLLKSENKNDTL